MVDVPLRGDAQAISVNWLDVEISNARGEITYRNSFITDLPLDATRVADLIECGRARWKVESVLQTHTERSSTMN